MSKQTIQALTATAIWCRAIYQGILTPTGKPKKPPTYLVVRCLKCGAHGIQKLKAYNIVDGERVKAKPLPCDAQKVSPKKTNSSARPRTVICKGRVTPVVRIGEDK